jgi:predicted CXXCH cytochrome family protein
MKRRLLVTAGRLSISLALLPACAEDTRYRVLTFFFDGVPEPGATVRQKEVGDGLPAAATPAERRPARLVYAHQPYRENECRDCHNPNGSWLIRTPAEGLCQQCHPDVPGSQPYVHGPAAANACCACHHPHESPFRWLLIRDPKDICLQCHMRSDLTMGPHHTETAEQPCLACHDPHGGADPYLLRQQEP